MPGGFVHERERHGGCDLQQSGNHAWDGQDFCHGAGISSVSLDYFT